MAKRNKSGAVYFIDNEDWKLTGLSLIGETRDSWITLIGWDRIYIPKSMLDIRDTKNGDQLYYLREDWAARNKNLHRGAFLNKGLDEEFTPTSRRARGRFEDEPEVDED